MTVDVSATAVVASTRLVNSVKFGRPRGGALRSSVGGATRPAFPTPHDSDNGGAHVHGAVKDQVNAGSSALRPTA